MLAIAYISDLYMLILFIAVDEKYEIFKTTLDPTSGMLVHLRCELVLIVYAIRHVRTRNDLLEIEHYLVPNSCVMYGTCCNQNLHFVVMKQDF